MPLLLYTEIAQRGSTVFSVAVLPLYRGSFTVKMWQFNRNIQLKANITAIKNIMISLNCPIDKAMDILKTPPNERQLLKDLLAKEI